MTDKMVAIVLPVTAFVAANLVPVIAGNLVGGSVLVGLAYHVIYQRGACGPIVASPAGPEPQAQDNKR